MIMPVLIPRGFSQDALTWSEWFTVTNENVAMTVRRRTVVSGSTYEVLLDMGISGTPIMRAVFAYATSKQPEANTYISHNSIPLVEAFLREAFHSEIVMKSAPQLSACRMMGLAFLHEKEKEDAEAFTMYQTMQAAIEISKAAQEAEDLNTSAFDSFINTLDLED